MLESSIRFRLLARGEMSLLKVSTVLEAAIKQLCQTLELNWICLGFNGNF